MQKVRTGVIGCGKISAAYARILNKHFSHIVELVSCADIDPDCARRVADEFSIPTAGSVEELLGDSEVELVINLTNPAAHYEVSKAALDAGKHVFIEKPMTTGREQARELVDDAEKTGLQIAGASDTFLGAGLQAARKALDDGRIGQPVSGDSFFGFRAKSEVYLQVYGGPLFDFGPYYLTALVSLLGPIARVAGIVQRPGAVAAGSKKPDGRPSFDFETPLNAAAVVTFENGCIGTFSTAGQACGYYPRIEVHGTEATLRVNDPNQYGGWVAIRDSERNEHEVPLAGGFAEKGRGLGVAEMAYAIRHGRKARANSEIMYHVTDALHAIRDSSLRGSHVEIQSTCPQPGPFDVAELMG